MGWDVLEVRGVNRDNLSGASVLPVGCNLCFPMGLRTGGILRVVVLLGGPFISGKLAMRWDHLAGGVGFDVSHLRVLGTRARGPAGESSNN